MATKMISIELDVYDALVAHRRHPKESFSQVIRRARWDDQTGLGSDVLAYLRNATPIAEERLTELEAIQRVEGRPDPGGIPDRHDAPSRP
jgi:predicted CopG family antitoxin